QHSQPRHGAVSGARPTGPRRTGPRGGSNMNHLLPLFLLAELNSGAPKPGDWRFGWDRVGLVAVGAFAIITIAWIVMRLIARRELREGHSPWCLFRELCTAHELSLRERQLLTRLAQHHRLEHHTALFI